MHVFEASTLNQLYLQALHELLARPCTVPSRNGFTSELHPCVLRLRDLHYRSLTLRERRKNFGLQLMEFLWIWHGSNRLAPLASVCKQWAAYSDDGVTLHGAYGSRLRNPSVNGPDQLAQCMTLLQRDPHTRQAVMTIWDPAQDLCSTTKDKPCNNWLHFMLRNERLDLTVVTRSNDVWWGIPYNVFNWTQLQCVVAARLGVEPGVYTHFTDSLHLYEKDRARALDVVGANRDGGLCIPWPTHGATDEELRAAYARVTEDGATTTPQTTFWHHYVGAVRRCQLKQDDAEGLSSPFREEMLLKQSPLQVGLT